MLSPDARIVRRVLAGDPESFGLLVDRYYERCVRFAMHVLGTREDAEDAAQETFLRAYRSLARYEERERFAAWLFRILVNQCRTILTRRRASPLPLAVWEQPSFEPEPDRMVDHTVLAAMLQRALAHLPPEQREAIVLRFGEELTYEEMATVTGAGVSALKMRVRRGCERLRAMLEGAHVG